MTGKRKKGQKRKESNRGERVSDRSIESNIVDVEERKGERRKERQEEKEKEKCREVGLA